MVTPHRPPEPEAGHEPAPWPEPGDQLDGPVRGCLWAVLPSLALWALGLALLLAACCR